MKPSKVGVLLLALAASALLLAACQSAPKRDERLALEMPLQTVAVLPFQRILPDGRSGSTATCPITGACYTPGNIAEGAEQALDAALLDELAQSTDLRVVTPAQAGPVFRSLKNRSLADERAIVAETGRKLGVDAVMAGYVFRYRERQGTAAAADQPAAVSFEVVLVASADGKVLWKNSFDQVQKPLSENILNMGEYLKRGIKWYSAAEFARWGMDSVFQSFPWGQDKAGN